MHQCFPLKIHKIQLAFNSKDNNQIWKIYCEAQARQGMALKAKGLKA